jgi:hypothetical protein
MIAGLISSVLSTPIDTIERWPPEKALDRYAMAIDIYKLTRGV